MNPPAVRRADHLKKSSRANAQTTIKGSEQKLARYAANGSYADVDGPLKPGIQGNCQCRIDRSLRLSQASADSRPKDG
jgi:hypothetical protein